MHSYYCFAMINNGPARPFGRSCARFPRPCRAAARRGTQQMSDGKTDPVRYFGRQVRKERLAAGWTLAEFGQRIGYDAAHLSRIESGKRPATGQLAQLCDQAFPHVQAACTQEGWESMKM